MAVKENVKDTILKFYTRTRKRPFEKQKSGSPVYQKYGAVLDEKTGNIKVKVISTYNIVDAIQSYRKDVDIYELIKKYQNGDLNALNRISCVYSDISSVPLDLFNLAPELRKIEGVFNSLSDEVKKDLNINNTRAFMDSILSGSLYDYIEKKNKAVINNKQAQQTQQAQQAQQTEIINNKGGNEDVK